MNLTEDELNAVVEACQIICAYRMDKLVDIEALLFATDKLTHCHGVTLH